MSEPEIARRCHHCGVSLRQTAFYCPQCGEQLSDTPSEPKLNDLSDAKIPENPPPIVSPAPHPSTVRERLENIRHVSSVVIDQAAYDPSLRFILVVAVVFVLFLVLLIISKVIG